MNFHLTQNIDGSKKERRRSFQSRNSILSRVFHRISIELTPDFINIDSICLGIPMDDTKFKRYEEVCEIVSLLNSSFLFNMLVYYIRILPTHHV